MNRSGGSTTAWFLCLVSIFLCLNNCADPKLGESTKSQNMMAYFAHNGIIMLLNYLFWQPVCYLLDPTEQSFPCKSKEMRARLAGVDESIGAKMCWKLVDNKRGNIICRSVIQSAIKPGTTNLQVDAIESLSDDATTIHDIEENAILDRFMSLANF